MRSKLLFNLEEFEISKNRHGACKSRVRRKGERYLREIKGKTLILKKDGETEEVLVDYVVFADEFTPRNNVFQEMIDRNNVVFQAGDCIRPKNLLSAIHEGANVAHKIPAS